MPRRSIQLAKLTRPRLHRAVPRERLFNQLDEAHDTRPAICVVGPPGAGKTTLVASWLDARNLRGIWYQVDPGDGDLATFFHYLGQAAAAFTPTGQRQLPALTPEYLADVPGFARRYFRELFRRMPDGGTLVLDNYQEVAPDEQFHALIADAVAEVPQGLMLVAVSRRDPPDAYARLIANENVSFVDWEDLRLTVPEAQAIAALRSARLEPARVAALHAQCDGWAAGLTLLLEDRHKTLESSAAPPSGTGRDAIFNYFAAQIFARVSENVRSFLMQTAHLPQIPVSVAKALTGEARTAECLEDLYHRHLFTHRRAGAEPTYWYHALFRSFLLTQAENLLSPDARRVIQQRAAQLLDSGGMIEDAMQLYQRIGDTEGSAALVLREAPRLLAQGRWKLVLEWIETLPKERVQSDCWLMHWLGTASIAIGPSAAREKLESSFELAERAKDDLCQIHAAAGIIENYMARYTHFRPLDRWIGVLESKVIGQTTFSDPDVELRVQSALLMALATRQPSNPRLAWCVERIFALLQVSTDVNLQVSAAMHLMFYSASTGPLEVGRRAQLHLDAIVDRPEVTAVNAGWAFTALSWFHCLCHNVAACHAAFHQAERIGEEHGLPWITRLGVINRMWLELFTFDALNGRKWVERLEQISDQSYPFDRAMLHSAKAWLALCEDKLDVALDHALKSVHMFDETGSALQLISCRMVVVIALFMDHQFDLAQNWIEQMRQVAGEGITDWVQSTALMWEANIALAKNDRGLMQEKLKQALGLAKRTGTGFIFYNWGGRWTPQICLEALRAGIEVGYVHELIRDYGFAPPSSNAPLWPWPVRIFTLGRFAILRDGKTVQFGRKAPRRVLAVLKYMVAQGGTGVALRQLADALWPDQEGDAALRALGVAMARVRKLLGGYDLLVVNDERASINRERVWVDTYALEQVIAEADGVKSVQDHVLLADTVDRLFSLYQGDFLPADRDESWALRPRLQLRARFVRCLGSLGARLEASGNWDSAIECYRRGLEADDLTEEFYQGLMRCYRNLAQPAEALVVFERLKQSLLTGLGVVPSPATESLARELQGQYRAA